MSLVVLASTKLFICSMKSIQYTHHAVVLVEPKEKENCWVPLRGLNKNVHPLYSPHFFSLKIGTFGAGKVIGLSKS